MNRRNFLTSLVAAIPATIAAIKAGPAVQTIPLGKWAEQEFAEHPSDLQAVNPDNMKILWQKTVDVYEQDEDFWVKFENPGIAVNQDGSPV